MPIDELFSQEPMDHFSKSVRDGAVNWQIYFHNLGSDQKADADKLLQKFEIITPDQTGTYSVTVSRIGIHPDFSLPVIDGKPANYKKVSEANGIANCLDSVRSEDQNQVVSARVERT